MATTPRRERAPYTEDAVGRLVEGFVWSDAGHWEESPASYEALRSVVEHRGFVDQEGFLEVLDLDRALAALRGRHPLAAFVTVAAMHGFETAEIADVLQSLRTPPQVFIDKSVAFMAAWLDGKDAEAAYRRGRRDVRA